MTLMQLSFNKCLITAASLACFFSAGDEWALVLLVGVHLVHDYLTGRHTEMIGKQLLELEKRMPDIHHLETDVLKIQEHIKNLQLTKLHRS